MHATCVQEARVVQVVAVVVVVVVVVVVQVVVQGVALLLVLDRRHQELWACLA